MAHGPFLAVVKEGYVYVVPVATSTERMKDEELCALARIIITPQGTVAKNAFGKAE